MTVRNPQVEDIVRRLSDGAEFRIVGYGHHGEIFDLDEDKAPRRSLRRVRRDELLSQFELVKPVETYKPPEPHASWMIPDPPLT